MNDTTFSDPEKILKQFPIRPSEVVADIGAGMGVYSRLAAHAVGKHGSVYAIDVQISFVDSLKKTAIKEDLEQLHVLWADAELPNGTKLADDSVDVVILTNVLFTIEDKPGLLAEIKRILKSNGRILVVDWQDSFGGIGPHPSHVVPEKTARNLFTTHVFDFIKNVSAGEHHYGMIIHNK